MYFIANHIIKIPPVYKNLTKETIKANKIAYYTVIKKGANYTFTYSFILANEYAKFRINKAAQISLLQINDKEEDELIKALNMSKEYIDIEEYRIEGDISLREISEKETIINKTLYIFNNKYSYEAETVGRFLYLLQGIMKDVRWKIEKKKNFLCFFYKNELIGLIAPMP